MLYGLLLLEEERRWEERMKGFLPYFLHKSFVPKKRWFENQKVKINV